jgi:hypothetical protein
VWNAPVIHQTGVWIGGRDGQLYSLELATGKTRWVAEVGAPLLNSPALDIKRGRVYIGSEAMRSRLEYELAHPRGGVLRTVPNGRMVVARWRRLTPDVARLISAYAQPTTTRLIETYVERQRPGWWIAWNVEQLMRNEAPFQLPTTPLEIFTARALLLKESSQKLKAWLDLPWCRADEFYIQKLALTLSAPNRPSGSF